MLMENYYRVTRRDCIGTQEQDAMYNEGARKLLEMKMVVIFTIQYKDRTQEKCKRLNFERNMKLSLKSGGLASD